MSEFEQPAIDQASLCPLCGTQNLCAMAAAQPAQDCWCTRVKISRTTLEKIPAADQGVRCICQACATQGGEPA